MNYIVLDLEWNQCPFGKEKENKKLPFEIIEIGAVKLDEKLNIIDEFDRWVCPQVYTSLHYIIKNLLDISKEELMSGDYFETVVGEFLEWCGEDYIFCTFGGGDLTELQRNMSFYNIEMPFPMPFKFYDIQKLYSIVYEDGKIRRSLQNVIEALGLSEAEEFHRAVNDARYTAKVMQKLSMDKVKAYYSIDCYRIPYRKSQEIYAVFPTYEKYISRGYRTKEAAVENKESSSCRCYICRQNCRTVIPWFSGNAKIYYGLFYCDEHGFVKTRMRVKQAENDKYYVVKIIKITDSKGADKIRNKQQALREKRKERRHHAGAESEQ